jgi:hypothetical protein
VYGGTGLKKEQADEGKQVTGLQSKLWAAAKAIA